LIEGEPRLIVSRDFFAGAGRESKLRATEPKCCRQLAHDFERREADKRAACASRDNRALALTFRTFRMSQKLFTRQVERNLQRAVSA
jgi:hypothetical protein